MLRSPDLSKASITEVVVLVLENHQDEVLLTKRKAGKHLAGYWEFPGGKIENDETVAEALIRECEEEIAYQPLKAKPILTINHSYPSKTVKIHAYHEIANEPVVHPLENQEMRWVHKSKLKEYQLPPANAAVTEYLNP